MCIYKTKDTDKEWLGTQFSNQNQFKSSKAQQMSSLQNQRRFQNWNAKTSFSPGIVDDTIANQDDSIWLSALHKSEFDQSENGMIQYSHKMDKVINIIEYPTNMKLECHCVCISRNKIYIIDGENGHITLFDPQTHSFTKMKNIPHLGSFPNAICVFDTIHIFSGNANSSYYLIYHPDTNKVIHHAVDRHKVNGATATIYNNRIIEMGGWDCSVYKSLDTFSMSSEIKENQIDKLPHYESNKKWKLPMPLQGFGCVIFKHYLLIFGGSTSGDQFIDAIYLLNLNISNRGWRRLYHIKCPIKSNYTAVIMNDHENTVHIFATGNQTPDWQNSVRANYSLPIAQIIGPEYTEFDLSILKGINITTQSIVNGYIQNRNHGTIKNMPKEIIDICVIYYFFLAYL